MDPTEDIRRAEIPNMPAAAQEALDAGERVWTTAEMQEDFIVEGFMAPYVVVTRKADGVRGTMQFSHSPRLYFNWQAD